MEFAIKHSLRGRVRVQLDSPLSEHEALAAEEILSEVEGVTKVTAYPLAGSIAVQFAPEDAARNAALDALRNLTREDLDSWEPVDPLSLAPRPRILVSIIANTTFWFLVRLLLVPNPFKTIWWLWSALPFWREALDSLKAKRLDVPVLDGASIALGFTQGANNAGETMYLLRLGEILEDYTQKRAMTSLARSLLNMPTTAWLCSDEEEIEVDISSLKQGDTVVVRIGFEVPVDGEVVSGEAMVNQSSLTGEPLAVLRQAGDTVFAGTAVEEGEIFVRVKGDASESKMRSIITMMENPDMVKSDEQLKMESMANKLVPWNFALAGIVALTTRSLTKTASVLMVDYSCALRMAGAIAVMAAQRQGVEEGAMVKGSLYFQALKDANVIIFDKTGTLTAATPKVCHVEPFGGYTRDQALRLAACLEEHFPHPVARAVVNAALEEGLEHREKHAAVEYVVAHGIASSLDGERVVIGSRHFVLEDEGVEVSSEDMARIEGMREGASVLLLAVDHKLRGAIFIEDPIREDAPQVIEQLREEGFERIIMLTGDEKHAAQRVADRAGITEFRAELLPEDKLEIVKELQAQGNKVCMVGDGVNDSPALVAADVSIAMVAGSAVAREAADIALVSNDLDGIVKLKRLAYQLDHRMKRDYRFTMIFNSFLLALGIAGVLTPQQSALFHNGSTIALSAMSSRRFSSSDT